MVDILEARKSPGSSFNREKGNEGVLFNTTNETVNSIENTIVGATLAS